MMKKLSITEQESLKSKLKDVDHDLLSKLLKISNVQLKTVYENIHINVITFEGYPDYGFNTYLSKKQAINRIVNLVIENENIQIDNNLNYYLYINLRNGIIISISVAFII